MNEEGLRKIVEAAGWANVQAIMELDRPVTIRVDIDGTICKRPKGAGYDQAQPIPERIAFFNELHRKGWWVIYWSDRAARGDYSELTEKQLGDWDCEYDQLLFDKPAYDIIVDDLAVNADSLFEGTQDATATDGDQSTSFQE